MNPCNRKYREYLEDVKIMFKVLALSEIREEMLEKMELHDIYDSYREDK